MRHSSESVLQAAHAAHSPKPSDAQLLRSIEFHDLLKLNRTQVFVNTTLSWPWLILGWFLAYKTWYVPAVLTTGMFYMLALRQAHDCYHKNIGLSPRNTQLLLHVLAITMMCVTHAVGFTHLQHHKHKLNEHDIEGSWSRKSAWSAIALGWVFYYKIQQNGLKNAPNRLKRHAYIDLALILAVLLLTAISQQPLLIYHVASMLVCSCLVGFFAVWSVHHGCDGEHDIARTERRPWLNYATAHLLFHVEHHTFPAVPCNHLPQLAKRMDEVVPHMTQKRET